MLRILRSGQRWLTAILVAGIGTVFVVFLGLQGPSDFTSHAADREGRPARVRHRRVRARARAPRGGDPGRARRSLRPARDARDARQPRRARARGERDCSRSRPATSGSRSPRARSSGSCWRIRASATRRASSTASSSSEYTQYVYGSQKAFMADRRLALLSMKMLALLQSQPEVSEGEAREAARRDLEEVQIAFATLDAGQGDPPEIAADAIAAAIASRARGDREALPGEGRAVQPARARARAPHPAHGGARRLRRGSRARARRDRGRRGADREGRVVRAGGGRGLAGPRLADPRRRSRVLRARPDGEGVRGRGVRADARPDERPREAPTSAST